MSAFEHARTFLLEHQAIIHEAMASGPSLLRSAARPGTDEGDLWRRYCHAMITPGQRTTERFWQDLAQDRTWQNIVRAKSRQRPRPKVVLDLFARHGVRFPENKAERIRRAWDRDFLELTARINGAMKYAHRRGVALHALRSTEIELCRLLQYELRDCGVGPKVSRLMMSWPTAAGPLFDQVIPVDSRWQKKLRESGVELSHYDLANEDSYRLLEEDLCRAAWSLYLPPRLADGAVFGWLGQRDEEDDETVEA